MTRPPPGKRNQYGAFRALPTRWSDNDAYGHMNNATYLALFDTAISLWQIDNGISITGPDAFRFLVVETGCRYHAEIGFPDTIFAGLRIGHLGTSSLRYDVGLFRNDSNIASAEGHFTQVLTDNAGRPKAIPAHIREILAPLIAVQRT